MKEFFQFERQIASYIEGKETDNQTFCASRTITNVISFTKSKTKSIKWNFPSNEDTTFQHIFLQANRLIFTREMCLNTRTRCRPAPYHTCTPDEISGHQLLKCIATLLAPEGPYIGTKWILRESGRSGVSCWTRHTRFMPDQPRINKDPTCCKQGWKGLIPYWTHDGPW